MPLRGPSADPPCLRLCRELSRARGDTPSWEALEYPLSQWVPPWMGGGTGHDMCPSPAAGSWDCVRKGSGAAGPDSPPADELIRPHLDLISRGVSSRDQDCLYHPHGRAQTGEKWLSIRSASWCAVSACQGRGERGGVDG